MAEPINPQDHTLWGDTMGKVARSLKSYVDVVTGEVPGLLTDKPYHNCEIWDLENCRDFVLAVQGLADELAATPKTETGGTES